MLSPPREIKMLLPLEKISRKKFENLSFSRSALFHMKTRDFIKYFLNDCRDKN